MNNEVGNRILQAIQSQVIAAFKEPPTPDALRASVQELCNVAFKDGYLPAPVDVSVHRLKESNEKEYAICVIGEKLPEIRRFQLIRTVPAEIFKEE